MKKPKPIHLTKFNYGYECIAVCDNYFNVEPIEATVKRCPKRNSAKGTFNPKKVTCKRCLKHSDYKVALDKVNNPLFYWKENR